MLIDQIQQELIQAQKDRDEVKVSTLRLLLSEIKYLEIQKGELKDEDILSVVQKELKKRQESVTAFKNAGRDDAAQKEQSEADILSTYLPEQLSDEELTKIVEQTINELGATSVQDMGRVIGAVRVKTGSSADGGKISLMVKEKLI